MRLVIQMKTSDNCAELKEKVKEFFGCIPNKKLGIQSFNMIAGS